MGVGEQRLQTKWEVSKNILSSLIDLPRHIPPILVMCTIYTPPPLPHLIGTLMPPSHSYLLAYLQWKAIVSTQLTLEIIGIVGVLKCLGQACGHLVFHMRDQGKNAKRSEIYNVWALIGVHLWDWIIGGIT